MPQEDTPPAPLSEPVVEAARRIRAEALELVRQYLAHGQLLAAIEQRAEDLDRQIRALAGQPGQDAPDVQRYLSDADLDIGFIYAGGRGASSVEAQQLIQGRR